VQFALNLIGQDRFAVLEHLRYVRTQPARFGIDDL